MSTLPDIYSNPSSIDPWDIPAKVTKKAEKKPKCKNPIFMECAKIVTNPYWKKVFTNASKGHFPPGYLFNKGTLSFKAQRRDVTLTICKDPHIVAEHCMEFFNQVTGMMDPREYQEQLQKERLKQNTPTILECEWKDLGKNLQDRFLCRYARRMGKEHDIDGEAFYSYLKYQFMIKVLKPEYITFQKGQVESIAGIEFHDGTWDFTKKKMVRKVKDEPIQWDPQWVKKDDMYKNFVTSIQESLRIPTHSYTPSSSN